MKSLLVTVVALFLATGCSKPDPAPTTKATAHPASTAPTTAAVDPHELYVSRCAPCHGTLGKGDGPAAGALTPKPRNYTDATWQASVKDDDIKKTILYGGAAVGKSPSMPANPDLEGKPELDGLLAQVRNFKGT